uniref:Uncharacterized protein n=1 Tax=Panagrolaimus sp. PS1159 TaxID=55785 RepID=A0AC35GFM2_9BILA
MDIFHLTNIQQYILPYLFNGKNDLLIGGTHAIGRTVGVLTSLLSQIHMFKHVQKARRGPLAVILLQSSAFSNDVEDTQMDTSQSTMFAEKFCKTLFLLSEHLNITTGFDSIDITKDICVITFKDIREHEERSLQYLQFFIAFNVEQIISKVGHEIFCARIGAFAPKHAATIFVMEDYHDPGPVMLRDCFKEDVIFISDKT